MDAYSCPPTLQEYHILFEFNAIIVKTTHYPIVGECLSYFRIPLSLCDHKVDVWMRYCEHIEKSFEVFRSLYVLPVTLFSLILSFLVKGGHPAWIVTLDLGAIKVNVRHFPKCEQVQLFCDDLQKKIFR